MGSATSSFAWSAHPGDWLIAEPHGEFLRILRRSTNDIEAQRVIQQLKDEGHASLIVLKLTGVA